MGLSPQIMGILGILLLLVIMFMRVPVAYGMLATGFLGMVAFRGWSAGVQVIVTTLYNKFVSYSFSPVPLFIFMGYLAYYSGILEELFDVAKKWIGHLHGGLINAGILGGAGFGAVCGAGNASSATLARLVVPELLKAKTERKITYGSVCASGILAPLIPPSVIGMLIAVVLEQSIGKVLIGGLLPGLLLTVLFMIYSSVCVHKDPSIAPLNEKYSWKARIQSLPRIWDFILIVLIIVVGIYGGFFSATEAGAVSSAAIIVILAIKRKLSVKIIIDALKDTMRTTASAFFIVGTAFAFGSFLTLTKLPTIFANWLIALPIPPICVMILIALFFLIVGMFMNVTSVIYITVPILAPAVVALGYDLIWFAVLLLMLTAIGGISPPFGATLFIMKGCIEESTMGEIYAGVLPYVLLSILGTILCIVFPQIIMVLPNLMVG